MQANDLPPAHLFASPDALQGLFLQALEAAKQKEVL